MRLRELVIFVASFHFAFSAPKRPHIVILMADDMGWNDVGYHGSEVPTPNIDALALAGIVLKKHYAHPACTPSRSAFITGQYAIRSGLQGRPIASNQRDGLPVNFRILPQVMKDLGYRTNLVGKWHLGYQTWDHYPTRRGWDTFYGYLNGYLGYYDGVHYDPPNVGLDFRSNEEGAWPDAYSKYLPEVLSTKATDLIKDHSKNHKGEPLFLFLAANAPHTGNKAFVEDTPPKRSNATDFIPNPTRRNLADVMRYVDDTLGNLTLALKSEGMLKDTILLFMGDNGGPTIDPVWGYDNAASNYPFRGVKMSLFEGGVRVPAVLWMDGLEPTAPRIYDNMFHIADWLPTFNAAGGGEPLNGLDGIDQWSALKGNSLDVPRTTVLVEINERDESWGYIKNNFKYVKSYNASNKFSFSNHFYSPAPTPVPGGYSFPELKESSVFKALGINVKNDEEVIKRWKQLAVEHSCSEENQKLVVNHPCDSVGCLFDLSKDPSECFEVSAEHPEVLAELKQELTKYKDVMVKRRPVPTDCRPLSDNYFGVPDSTSSGNRIMWSVHNVLFLSISFLFYLFPSLNLFLITLARIV